MLIYLIRMNFVFCGFQKKRRSESRLLVVYTIFEDLFISSDKKFYCLEKFSFRFPFRGSWIAIYCKFDKLKICCRGLLSVIRYLLLVPDNC
jgi:hypothetical protein